MLIAPSSSRRHNAGRSLLLLLAGALLVAGHAQSAPPPERIIKPVVPPKQLGELIRGQSIEAGSLINVGAARLAYGVSGAGYTAAVMDTGIRATHVDFAGRVVAQRNYTTDNGGNINDANDGEGHGTNVSGIVLANGVHVGMAPAANVAALKVLDNNGSGGGAGILAALDWVIANRVAFNITVVNMSLGDGGNYTTIGNDAVLARVTTLRNARVAVCAAAGNDYFEWGSTQGMGWPAVHPDTVSVGAVYDANIGPVGYGGAFANTTAADRITPFSQRLHPNVNASTRTDVFAPGAEITSAGITSDTSSSSSHGTSQACPAVAGIVILLQEYAVRITGNLPTVDQLENWIRQGAVTINDGDDEDDNVTNTGLNFPRINALAALQAAEQELATSVSPSNLNAGSISHDSISLTWTDNNTNETGFEIDRALGAGAFSFLTSVGPNISFYVDQGLNSNTSYTYRVRATTALGPTAYTNSASALTFPEDPSGLTVTTPAPPAGRSQLNLSWNDNSDLPTAFEIYRSLNPLNIVNLHATTSVGATTFTDTGLSSATTYYYKVRAINARGPSLQFSGTAQGTTLPAPPTAPGALTATVQSPTSISLNWNDNSTNETGYRLERVNGTSFLAGTGLTSVPLAANATSRLDTNLTPNTTYTYRVFATNASGDSLASAEAGGTTFPEIPADPGAVTVTAQSDTSLQVEWLDNSTNETGFRIERFVNSAFVQVGTVTANQTSFLNTGLLSNTSYTFRVRALNGVSVSGPSPTGDGLTLPAAPTGLAVLAQSTSQVLLTWTDASASPSAFKIERKTDGGYTELDTTGVGEVSYTDGTATANTAYTYRIRGTNASGDGDYSAQVSVSTPPNPPAAPTNLVVSVVSQSTLLLSWNDNSSDETAFKIERSSDGSAYITVATVNPNTTGFTNNGLAANTTYWFRVKATNAGGDSMPSNVDSEATLPNVPPAPSGLSVSVVSQTELQLSWTDTSSDESGFKIESSTDGSSFTAAGATGADVQTFTAGSLTANTRYYFRVKATNAGGDSAPSNVASAITLPNPPTAPTSPAVVVVSSTSLQVTWVDASNNETSFTIERSLDGSVFTAAGTVSANVTSFTNSGLTPMTLYYFRVAATNAGGSSFSGTVTGTTPPVPPAAPANLTATAVSSSSIQLGWSDTSTETGFRIERAAGGGAFAEIGTAGANVLTFTDSGRAANTLYVYRVKAFNGGGDSVPSNTAEGLTLPGVPGSVTVTVVSATRLDIGWTDTNPQPAAVRVERAPSGGGFIEVGQVQAGISTFADVGRAANTTYQYRLRASNASGFSGYTDVASGTTLPLAPTAPSGLTVVTGGAGTLNVSWTDTSNNETGFLLERGLDGVSFGQIGVLAAGATSYSDSGLQANTSYSYRVRAFNAGGNSNYAGPVAASTVPNPPAAPSALAVSTGSSSQLNLTWNDNSGNEAGFKIERASDGVNFSVIAVTAANATAFANTGLTAGATFQYRVRATNGGGDSDFSGPISGTTFPNAPAAPTNLTATAQSATAVRLNWVDASSNEDGFIIERRTGNAGAYVERFRTAANATQYAEDVLLGDTDYMYRVRAFNGGGDSAGVEASVSTLTGVLSVQLQRSPSKAGKPVKCTVTLTGPAPAGGAVVTITSSAQSVAKAPATLRIKAGKQVGSFTVQTRKAGIGAAATITATYGGQSASAVLTLIR